MSILPDNYIETIIRLKNQISQARIRAALKANRVLLDLYWEIGHTILQMQQNEGWGTKVIDRISSDLRTDFPDFTGLSVRNLKYMVSFAKAFPQFGQQLAAQIQNTDNQTTEFVQQAAAQLPWGHIQVLLDKADDNKQLLFYAQKCIENGWSRNILVEQIKGGLYARQGNAITNFSQTLPTEMSDLAQQTLKNPYLFDFLSLGEKAKERDLENALIQHLKQFMLELGRGFAYVGKQKNLVVEGDDFFLDLLFYNYHLHCFVVFELKVGDFKPEFAGKLNFYVNTVNEQLKGKNHRPTIGVLLCKTPNETVVKYSLQGIESPIGVAEYQLSDAIPKQLKGELPSIEELEIEIDRSYKELKSPQETKLDLLREKLIKLGNKSIETAFTFEIWEHIFDKSLVPLFKKVISELEKYRELYLNQDFFWSGSNNITDINNLKNVWKEKQFIESNSEFYFRYRFWALKQSGTDAWDGFIELKIIPDAYFYSIYVLGNSLPVFKMQKLYSELPIEVEVNQILNYVMDSMNNRIEEYIKWKETQQ